MGIVVLTTIVFSVAAYAALFSALALRQRGDFYQRHAVASYAAEAGMVWAMQRLWRNPNDCFSSATEWSVDPDNNSATNNTLTINIRVTALGTPFSPPVCSPPKKLSATVSF